MEQKLSRLEGKGDGMGWAAGWWADEQDNGNQKNWRLDWTEMS